MPPQPTVVLIDEESKCLIDMHEQDKIVKPFLEESHKSFQYEDMCSIQKEMEDINPRGPYKRSLIHYAAMGNCTMLLFLLLNKGAPIEDHDQNKRTPLSWAAEYGAYEATKRLVEKGANVNSLDDIYTSPLGWLIRDGYFYGNLPATEEFLKKNGAVAGTILDDVPENTTHGDTICTHGKAVLQYMLTVIKILRVIISLILLVFSKLLWSEEGGHFIGHGKGSGVSLSTISEGIIRRCLATKLNN